MVYSIQKAKAISFRRSGLSYSEILREIPVAKSTLSLWLREVNLSKRQQQRLTAKKRAAILRGGAARHNQRVVQTKQIFALAKQELGKISSRDLNMLGIALYWAEGSKQKEHNPGSGVVFANSDPKMIKVFLRWIKEIGQIELDQIRFEIYIHENSVNNLPAVKKFWSQVTNAPLVKFESVYFKHNKPTNRRNVGALYYGLLRVKVKSSATLCRQIMGSVQAIVEQC